MKKTLLASLLGITLAISANNFVIAADLSKISVEKTAAIQQNKAPDEIVKVVITDVLETLNKHPEIKTDSKKLSALIEEKIVPHINFRRMTALAVGKDWRKTTEEQKLRLTKGFGNLLIKTYSNALAGYGDEKMVFKPLKMKPDDNEVNVRIEIHQAGNKPINFDTYLEKKDNAWFVYDVSVAGISLVTNYREQFNQTVRQGGFEALLDLLENKSDILVEKAKEETDNAMKQQ